MGAVSIVWYVVMTILSQNILADSIVALGLMIAFYYGITGFACAIFYRRELTRSAKNFLLAGVVPTLGGLMLLGIFVKALTFYGKPANATSSFLGVGSPVVIGIGALILGLVLMLVSHGTHRDFFRRKTEVAKPGLLEEPATAAPTSG